MPKDEYRKPEIRSTTEPSNTDGLQCLPIRLDSIEVGEWHPLPDGQGDPTEVHVSLMIDGLEDLPLVMRFKSPGTLDALISALAVHRFHV